MAAFVQFCRRRQKLTRPEEGMTERGEVTRSCLSRLRRHRVPRGQPYQATGRPVSRAVRSTLVRSSVIPFAVVRKGRQREIGTTLSRS